MIAAKDREIRLLEQKVSHLENGHSSEDALEGSQSSEQ